MKKYAKILDEQTKEVSVGIGSDTVFYKKIGMVEMDVEQAYNSRWYLIGYAPEEPKDERILKEIAALESEQKPRLMREFGLDSRAGKTAETSFSIKKVEELNAKIEELRKQLSFYKG